MNKAPSRRLDRRRGAGHRRTIAAVLIILVTAAPAAAETDDCDGLAGETLNFIVPNKAGGGYDAYSRLLQPFLERRLDATIVIDNRPQAGGIVGAAAIRDAAPDGKTIGILNASGLLAASLDRRAPNPATDFTILGRVLSNHTVVLTGRDSGIDSLDELLRLSKTNPTVIGVRDAGSAGLFAVPVTAALLDMDYALVAGYVGSNARVMAAIRGEIDLLVQNFDSTRRFIETGELRPLLQLASIPAMDRPEYFDLLDGVPVLTGENGAAARHARSAGRPAGEAFNEARALAALIDAGRVIAAPPGLSEALRGCLATAVDNVLTSVALRAAAAKAQLRIAPADAATARADILAGAQALEEFAPLVRAAMQRATE